MLNSNTADGKGGVISSEGNLWRISNSSFSQNDAFSGGAIYFSDASLGTAVEHSLFDVNTAILGGSFYLGDCTNVVSLLDIGIYGGDAAYGGGIYNRQGTVEMNEVRLGSNHAYQGGGLFQFEALSIINDSWFGNNQTEYDTIGDAIYNLVSFSEISNTDFCGGSDTMDSYVL
jgi:predicted outer membrane repeat protein